MADTIMQSLICAEHTLQLTINDAIYLHKSDDKNIQREKKDYSANNWLSQGVGKVFGETEYETVIRK